MLTTMPILVTDRIAGTADRGRRKAAGRAGPAGRESAARKSAGPPTSSSASSQAMTGTKLAAQSRGNGPVVHIGRDAFVDRAGLELDRLDEDGFVIRTVDDRHLILAGRTPHATEFAVYRFLQKHGGVRWYFPTALGEVVPRRTTFRVGPLAEREEPSFHSRQWSAAAPFDNGVWERHNFCRARYNFHHNLLNIFVPSKLYDAHPEWFPEIDGKRLRPKDDQDHGWQPCLSNLEAARYAAQVARQYFDAQPGSRLLFHRDERHGGGRILPLLRMPGPGPRGSGRAEDAARPAQLLEPVLHLRQPRGRRAGPDAIPTSTSAAWRTT